MPTFYDALLCIQILLVTSVLDPDPGRPKFKIVPKKVKNEEISCFEIFFFGPEASLGA